jgi:SnoaL-like domain
MKIEQTVRDWHRHLAGELPGGLDALLHDDVVFHSPVVFTPQEGKAITKLYLQAAQQTFPGDHGGSGEESGGGASFRYVREVLAGHHAVLEFETRMGGIVVNGADFITCDDDGRIVEFKVMIRPLKAVNAVHERMRAMLEAMAKSAAGREGATGSR